MIYFFKFKFKLFLIKYYIPTYIDINRYFKYYNYLSQIIFCYTYLSFLIKKKKKC